MTATASPARRRALRVAMVHYSDFRLDSRIQRQARALAARGDEVHLACLGEDDRVDVGGGTIHVHGLRGARRGTGVARYVHGYSSFLAAAGRCVAALDRLDVVEIHNMPDALVAAALLSRRRGTPVI
ncbi:MAG: glycosyl transferase group 1, partial [Frankiales bacterium]|nr:glycosyl transferase group 1 [Frankiales bacterium]